MKFEAITTVYSYLFPEVRELMIDMAKSYNLDRYLQPADDPTLDYFHEPVIDNVLRFHTDSVPNLKDFAFRYPTAGSEEGIREFQTKLQSTGVKKIYVWKGEYEGFKEVGKTRCIEAIEVDPKTDPRTLKPGIWFLSNPSAIDGNIIPNEIVNNICDAGHKVFYDLSYLGSTRPNVFDLRHENIVASVVSFSKPFGLFRHRVGFTFGREEIPSLKANIWFKNDPSLLIADKIATEIKPDYIYRKYRPLQERIVERINEEFYLGMRASDALLLGHITSEDLPKLDSQQLEMIKRFKRGYGYRFCLREYYLKSEKENF